MLRFCLSFLFFAVFSCGGALGDTETLTIGGTGSALGLVRQLADEYRNKHPRITFVIPKSLGSSGGIRALLAGKLDVSLSTRLHNPEERGQGAVAHPVCRTPLAFVTSRTAKTSLTTEETVSYFASSRNKWPDGEAVSLILRPKKETDNDIITKAFPGMAGALGKSRARRNILIAYTDQQNMDLAENLKGSLTIAAVTAVLAELRTLRFISLDGVAPSRENLINGSYPLAKHIYFVTRPGTREAALGFVRHVTSGTARAVLDRLRCFPLTEGER